MPHWTDRLRGLGAKYERVWRWVGPILALKTGVAAVVLIRHGVDFAPLAVAAVLFAWTLTGVLVSRLAIREDETPSFRFLRFLVTALVAAVYQNVIFFLVPLWFGSATPTSINIIAPCLISAMALLTCFERIYSVHILRHPSRCAAFSAFVLFAALVAAAPIFVRLPLRAIFAAAAAISVIIGAVSALPFQRWRSWKTPLATIGAALASAILMAQVAPMFPPVPVECIAHASATAIKDREPEGKTDELPAGIERAYVWFSVAAPQKYSEKIRFEWYRDGEPLGKAFETEFTGGRKSGFRTWSYISTPRPAEYRVDLYAASDQLIARHRFKVR